MATQTKTTVSQLEREVRLLRSFVIGLAGKDPEGAYRPAFVKRILNALSEEPRYRFTNAKRFLTDLRRSGRP